MSASVRSAVTVVIATLNEECHIERCLTSVGWAAGHFVVDAFSTDRTVEVAERAGATVVQHAWSGYSQQKNWALDTLPIQTDWILLLDADECVTPELAAEVRQVVAQNDSQIVGYYVSRRLDFLGRPMRHAWWYPDKVVRLFRRGYGRFDERSVHERIVLNGRIGELRYDLAHDNRKGLAAFIDRHNRYSTLEALEILRYRSRTYESSLRSSFRGDWAQRRRALKERVWWQLPLLARPAARFVYMYFWRRGFLDGIEGLLFSMLIATYELQIDAKYFELTRLGEPRGIPPLPTIDATDELEESSRSEVRS